MSGSHLLLAGIIYLIHVVIMTASGVMQREIMSNKMFCITCLHSPSQYGGGGGSQMTVPVFDFQLCDFSTAETELHESWETNRQADSCFR